MHFYLQTTVSLQREVGIVCLSTLDMLIQTVLLSMDRSAPILVNLKEVIFNFKLSCVNVH